MASKFDEPSPENCLKNPLDYLPDSKNHSMFLHETDQAEILTLISSLEKQKACGYDHISNKILKSTSYVIAPFLAKLFNECMQQGIFPDAYKIAKVIPLFKGGDKEDMNCYRPISLLPALGKLFEKVISKRVTNYLDHFNLLSPQQFGFRAKFSTEHAILDIHEKLLKNLDSGLTSCAIFLDLAKAFDSVSHDILIKKLEKYGIRGNVLKLFQSYLDSRTQFVQINNHASNPMNIEFGVPQGSILGPLLFLLYINDLPNATNFFIRLFADDTFLCAQNKDVKMLETTVNIELDKVFCWLVSNKLTLNISKSKFMMVSKKRKIQDFSVKIKDENLEKCNSYKYLGVFIDKDLTWKPHVEYISNKISKACGALSKLRHCIGIDTLKTIYYALVNSYLRYGLIAWGNASPSIYIVSTECTE